MNIISSSSFYAGLEHLNKAVRLTRILILILWIILVFKINYFTTKEIMVKSA